MTVPEPVDRTTEPDDVFDAPVDIVADVREETVARAICEADVDVDAVSWAWDGTDKDTRDQYRRLARAAISADPGPDTDVVSEANRLVDAITDEQAADVAAALSSPGPDTADQLRQRVHDLADRHERSAAHRERLAARWTDAERHQLADAFRRLAHQSRVEALRVRAVAGPRRDEEAGRRCSCRSGDRLATWHDSNCELTR